MSSDIQSTFIEAATADADGVCASQTPSGAGNLTINGALADSGAVHLTNPDKLPLQAVAMSLVKHLLLQVRMKQALLLQK